MALNHYIRAVNLAGVDIEQPTVLAPLAGWSDAPFRRLCREFGAGLVYTEMVSADGAIREQQKTLELAQFEDSERPIAIQIFGAEPQDIAGATKVISDMQPDFIDLNFGCPAKKVLKRGSGAALLRNLPLLQHIAKAAVDATDIPIAAKLRSGWDAHSINVVEAAQRLQDVGVKLLAIHPRTQSMQFRGKSDWSLIAAVKQAVDIPVIGNGDIQTPQDAKRMIDETGCDAIMLGRAACGNPWLFQQVNDYLSTGIERPLPTMKERLHVCIRHLDLTADVFGPRRGVLMMRKQVGLYLKGMPNATDLRRKIFTINRMSVVKDTLFEYLEQIEKHSILNKT